jgi:hypothetical protein
MIYIFNSAYRPLYATNVLVTLFLPNSYINQYRYRHEIHVDPILFKKLNNKTIRDGEDVLIGKIEGNVVANVAFLVSRLSSHHFSHSTNATFATTFPSIFPGH